MLSHGFSFLAGPRRFIWRRTIGRFRSEEAVYKSAERQYQTLAETLDGQVPFGLNLDPLTLTLHLRTQVGAVPGNGPGLRAETQPSVGGAQCAPSCRLPAVGPSQNPRGRERVPLKSAHSTSPYRGLYGSPNQHGTRWRRTTRTAGTLGHAFRS